MREIIRNILAELPPEGIAIHGTNLSRAQSIAGTGYIPCKEFGNRFYYNVQPPTDISYYSVHEDIWEAIGHSTKHALRATRIDFYRFSFDQKDVTPALLVLIPPMKPFIREHGHPTALPYEDDTSQQIHPESVLGVIVLDHPDRKLSSVEKTKFNRRTTNEIMKILVEKEVVYLRGFGGPQQPQEE